jgi:ribonuclease BN (tRNA processing enzyme)
MKLIFFGTTSAVQTANNTNVSLAIIHKNEAVLIDASGSPFQSLLHAKINASDLGALVLTHGHPDHQAQKSSENHLQPEYRKNGQTTP